MLESTQSEAGDTGGDDNKFDSPEKVGLLYEDKAEDLSSSSDTEKLEIVEDDKNETVVVRNEGEDSSSVKSELEDLNTSVVVQEKDNNDVVNDSADIIDGTSANTAESGGTDSEVSKEVSPAKVISSPSTHITAKEQKPLVIATDTLVRNIDTTQMVTSETQTYETVAQVTEFTENIVAETIIDDENANIEYTPDVIPEHLGIEANCQEDSEEVVLDNIIEHTEGEDNTSTSPDNHEDAVVTGHETVVQQNSSNTCSEMDCQTEMDPELLALIEAAEQIEAAQQAQDGGGGGGGEEYDEDGFEDAQSSTDEEIEEDIEGGEDGEEEEYLDVGEGDGQQQQQGRKTQCEGGDGDHHFKDDDEDKTSVEL